MATGWRDVDDYIAGKLLGDDDALAAALANNKAQDLPPIDVSATQGKMLFLLAQIAGARRILEIGTLGGYSTIWLARALPEGGALVTLELDPRHRPEEHTSELQSLMRLTYAVFCLKKKMTQSTKIQTTEQQEAHSHHTIYT